VNVTLEPLVVAAQGSPVAVTVAVPHEPPPAVQFVKEAEVMSRVEEAGVRTWTPRVELEHAKVNCEFPPTTAYTMRLAWVSVLLVFRGAQVAAEAMDGTAIAAIAVTAAMSVVFLMVFIGYCSL
jgi:amino acid transporter